MFFNGFEVQQGQEGLPVFFELAGIRTNDSCEFAFYIAPIRFQWFGSIFAG